MLCVDTWILGLRDLWPAAMGAKYVHLKYGPLCCLLFVSSVLHVHATYWLLT